MDNNYTNELPEKKCSSCSAMISVNDMICPYCGGVQMPDKKRVQYKGHDPNAEMKVCRTCNEVVSIGTRVCPKCGRNPNSASRSPYYELRVCKYCNNAISVKARKCPKCGQKQAWYWRGAFCVITLYMLYLMLPVIVLLLVWFLFGNGISDVEDEANCQTIYSIVQEAEQADCPFDFIE